MNGCGYEGETYYEGFGAILELYSSVKTRIWMQSWGRYICVYSRSWGNAGSVSAIFSV